MKILAIADEPCKALWDYCSREKLEGIDLILCAGDLPAAYLEHLSNFTAVPILYVNGNHDRADKQPGGCFCIDDTMYTYKGYRILGFGGCLRYNKKSTFQYTEREMRRRIAKHRWTLLRKGGFDILLAHSPAADINDGPDRAHLGFACFTRLLQKYKPAFFVHGHVHLRYDINLPRSTTFEDTTVINAYERYIFEVPDKI